MNADFLTPVEDSLLTKDRHGASLFHQIKIHSKEAGYPDLEKVKVAVFGVVENRAEVGGIPHTFNFFGVRDALYDLFPGNWQLSIADLGNIHAGATIEDTHFAVKSLVEQLLEENIIPVILGGSQDITYAQYRAYDQIGRMVNLVNIDGRFDLGDAEQEISNVSYVSKMIVNQPYNLFNYSNIGYQTYYNSQDEIELMERLFFDAYRLGEASSDFSAVEPVMRDADLVSMDITALNAAAMMGSGHTSPNGFDSKEVCGLARYAGISDKVSSFGIYELQKMNDTVATHTLVAQSIWYFLEGVNYRKDENTISSINDFLRYQVPVDDEVLIFFQSPNSGRWWIEIPFYPNLNNKLKKQTLLPCTHQDYLSACNQEIPERWYKARRKNEL